MALRGAALAAGICAASAAQAECTFTFDNEIFNELIPLGQGGAVNSLLGLMNTANTAFMTQSTAFVTAPGGPAPDQPGSGAWGRVVGGLINTENNSATTISTVDGLAIPGAKACNTSTKQDFVGFQVGHDLAKLNLGNSGANVHIGFTAGYFESNAKEQEGTFKGSFQTPFAGIYAAVTQGNFFADAQARLDYYQNRLSDIDNGLFDQSFNGRGVTLAANAGYRIDLPNGYFIEPSAGATWSRVSLDALNMSGTLALPAPIPGISLPGTVQIDDIESLLGRASVRVGTSFAANRIAYQPFVTVSVYREFAGSVTTTTNTAFATEVFEHVLGEPGFPNLTATTTTSRVGTYYQIGAGLGVQILDTGWAGYGRLDYRTGDNIDGLSANVGLRYAFSPDVGKGGHAAPARAVVRAYNWTGSYAGLFAGSTWGEQDWVFVDGGTTTDPEFAGYLVGGQVGYNYQTGQLVFGIEADIGGANASGGKSCPNGFFFTCESELNSLGSLTGRIGYAWDRALFYAKGGLAFGRVSTGIAQNTGGFGLNPVVEEPLGGQPVPTTETTKWQTGWTAGAGVEFALTQQWSARAEWMYYDLGSATYQTFFAADATGLVDADTQGHSVRVGVNYHFGK
jgi:opacity protein-like surface antigen